MRRYHVKVMPEVDAEIETQTMYIASDSVDRALEWARRLRRSIAAIGEHPGYAVDEEATGRVGAETRKMVFEGTYLVFFQINETAGVVEVIGFRHGMRLPREGEA